MEDRIAELQKENAQLYQRAYLAEKDALIMALRLLGEDESTYSPETYEVMSRWRPKALEVLNHPNAYFD